MKQRLAVRLVLSHLLVILVVSGIASVVLLTQSRRYFVNADRRALLVQAQVAAKNCDDLCLETGVGTFNVSNAQLPPAAIISQNRGNVESNVSLTPEPLTNPSTVPAGEQPSDRQPGRDPADSAVAESEDGSATAGSGSGQGDSGEGGLGQGGSGQAGSGQGGSGQSRIQASLANYVQILRPSDKRIDSVGLAALAGRSSSGTVGRNVVAAAPILRAGKVVGAVEVRSDLRNVEGVLGDLRRRILVAVAGSALLAMLIGFWRARSIAQPLRELTVAARAVADGNFAQPLPTPKGHDELAVLTTTFGEMRDRVQHELAVRNAFVADASHELRTPLTAIRGAVEILQDGGAERPEVRDRFLQSLGNETNRLLGLVDGLLQLETNGQGFAVDENLDLYRLSHEVFCQMKLVAETKSITMFWEVTSETRELGYRSHIPLRGNDAKLRQLLIILLDNSITYSPPSTSVLIAVGIDEQTNRRTIEVHDSGPGIPEADRERVFERFVRLDQSRNRIEQNQLQQNQLQHSQLQQNQLQHSQLQHGQLQQNQTANNAVNLIKPGGAGLGLAIARSIVVAHGGTLTLRTRRNGIGTIARIELPHEPNQIDWT